MASIRSRIGENMEDRCLFKAKRLDNGEWVQGYLFDDGYENGRLNGVLQVTAGIAVRN